MNILVVSPHFCQYTETLYRNVNNYKLAFFLDENNYSNECGHKNNNLSNYYFFKSSTLRFPFRIISSYIYIKKLIRNFRPDVVHFVHFGTEQSFLFWMACSNIKRVVTIHDVVPHSGRDSKQSWRTKLLNIRKFIAEQADAIIVHGNSLKLELAERWRPKAYVVPHPIFEPHHIHETVDGDVKNLFSRDLTMTLIGRIEAYKGLNVLYSAIRQLGEGVRNIRTLIAGSGPLVLPEDSNDLNIKILNRYLSDVEFQYIVKRSDILVLPYLDGSASGIIAYGIGFQKPMIVSRVGSFSEYLVDGETALFVEPGDHHDLTRAISQMTSSGELRKMIAMNLSKLAVEFNRNSGLKMVDVFQTI